MRIRCWSIWRDISTCVDNFSPFVSKPRNNGGSYRLKILIRITLNYWPSIALSSYLAYLNSSARVPPVRGERRAFKQ